MWESLVTLAAGLGCVLGADHAPLFYLRASVSLFSYFLSFFTNTITFNFHTEDTLYHHPNSSFGAHKQLRPCLTEACLTEACLTEAGLTEAYLTEACLTEAGLTEATQP